MTKNRAFRLDGPIMAMPKTKRSKWSSNDVGGSSHELWGQRSQSVCVCMHKYKYIYICVCIYVCVYTYIRTYIHYITLHYIYITLHYITLNYIALHYITYLHYITLHCIALQLHCIALHYVTLHYIALHYITYILYIYAMGNEWANYCYPSLMQLWWFIVTYHQEGSDRWVMSWPKYEWDNISQTGDLLLIC